VHRLPVLLIIFCLLNTALFCCDDLSLSVLPKPMFLPTAQCVDFLPNLVGCTPIPPSPTSPFPRLPSLSSTFPPLPFIPPPLPFQPAPLSGIARCSCMKMLGVTVGNDFSVSQHVQRLVTSSAQARYAFNYVSCGPEDWTTPPCSTCSGLPSSPV